MSRARTWNLRLNLDEFNAAFANLEGAEEVAEFTNGLYKGMNGGMARDGKPQPFNLGFALGHEMREEAEAYRMGRAEIGRKGGRPPGQKQRLQTNHLVSVQEPYGNHVVNFHEPYGNHSETQSTIHNPQSTEQQSLFGKPAKKKAARKAFKPDSQTLAEILAGGREAPYWKVASVFGAAKNPAPRTTARLYLEALGKGVTEAQIQDRAESLRKSVGEEKYMPQLAKWLEGEGYLSPDAVSGCSITRSPEPPSLLHGYLEQNQAFFGGIHAATA